MGASVGGGGPVKSEPNVVPMIDIMLVLLIIFMIVTPIISSGFQATMPLAIFFKVTGSELMPYLMRHVFLGLMIGDSVGLGVEVADLLILARAVRQSRASNLSE